LWHIKRQNSTTGLSLQLLTAVCCEVIGNLKQQLQECTAHRVDQLGDVIFKKRKAYINPLKAELNPICQMLALLEVHPILHVSRLKVKWHFIVNSAYIFCFLYSK
jgi:hypothetical protein